MKDYVCVSIIETTDDRSRSGSGLIWKHCFDGINGFGQVIITDKAKKSFHVGQVITLEDNMEIPL